MSIVEKTLPTPGDNIDTSPEEKTSPPLNDAEALHNLCISSDEINTCRDATKILAKNPLALAERHSRYNKTLFHRLAEKSENTALADIFLDYAKKNAMPNLINEVDTFGNTPLIWAIANANVKMACHIISKCKENTEINLNIHDTDWCQSTALHLAIAKGWDHKDKDEQFLDPMSLVIQALLENNANPNATDINGNTPLHIAMIAGDVNSVTLLIKNGAKLDIKNRFNLTPLQILSDYTYEKAEKFINIQGGPHTFPAKDIWEKNKASLITTFNTQGTGATQKNQADEGFNYSDWEIQDDKKLADRYMDPVLTKKDFPNKDLAEKILQILQEHEEKINCNKLNLKEASSESRTL